MYRYKLLPIVLILILLVSACRKELNPPNFLIVFTDDQRLRTLGCYSADCPIETPNIDGLAREGVLFSHGFVTTPICVCSRASLLTGRYTTNSRVHQFVTPMEDDVFADIYPQHLKKAGYFTGQYGKYGVGITPVQEKLFDRFDGTAYQGPAFREYKGKTMHDAEWLTVKAEEFLDAVPQDQPFCLQLNYKEPHPSSKPALEDDHLLDEHTFTRSPMDTDEAASRVPEFVRTGLGNFKPGKGYGTEVGFNNHMRQYYEKIVSVDRSVGKLRAMLEERGLANNTVIIFLSDHGTHHGERHFIGKWRPYDESLRIPFIVYDPRKSAKKGIVSDELVLNIDVAPTLLDLAGISVPETMDGRSLASLISGERIRWRDHFFFEHYCSPCMVPSYIARNVGVRFRNAKYLQWIDVDARPGNNIEEYYDLDGDPMEARNLVDEPGYREAVESARKLFHTWRTENPSSFRYDVYGPRAQFGSPVMNWEEFKQYKPNQYARIKAEVERLGVTWEQALTDWETRLEICTKAVYWY
jgi:arylsulfatase A-like enzyme